MKTNMLFLSIIQCLLLCSCNRIYPDEKLTIQRRDYNGNEIRTDGYYYSNYSNSAGNHIAFLFFYINGTVLYAGSSSYSNMNAAEAEMLNNISENKKEKSNWGVFIIDGNRVEHERWQQSFIGYSYIIRRDYGIIENDTTIHFIESYNSETKETFVNDFVYHFRQFDNKPDSTNNFIK
jgi:hypothetical protein